MATTTIGVVRERAPGERRVALVPEVVGRLCGAGLEVLVEPGAGAAAWFDDTSYAAAGARLVPRDEVYRRADVLTCVRAPGEESVRAEQTVIGLLEPYGRPAQVRAWAKLGVTALSLDSLPGTLRHARAMDALSSQATFAGYKAALLAADLYGGFFPSMAEVGGTGRPASVLVLGTGVGGRTAIGTAKRLGALVSTYDNHPKTRAEMIALGARLLDLPRSTVDTPAGREPGALTEEQRRALGEQVHRFDAVLATLAVPGRRPPLLLTAEALHAMRPGSVVVDLASGPVGGNVEESVPDTTTVTRQGVTVVGAGNLPATMAPAASEAYARNIAALLTHLLRNGFPAIDVTEEITASVLVTHAGEVIDPHLARLLSEG